MLIGQKTGQAAFDAGCLGRTEAHECLRHPGQARGTGQHDAQDTEGQRFAPMSMQLRQKRPQLRRPLVPQTRRCVHYCKRS